MKTKKEIYEIDLVGYKHAVAQAWIPSGGRGVCDIRIDSHDQSIRLRNVPFDVACRIEAQLADVTDLMLQGDDQEDDDIG